MSDELFTEPAPSPDNVVEFRPRTPADTAELELLATKPRPDCRHRRRVIDAQAHEVHCRECGQKLDPFWCLVNLDEYRALLDRKLASIREFDERQQARQQRAIQREQRRRRRGGPPAENCAACGGTGWKNGPGGVQRCPCKATGIPQIV